MKYFYKYLFFCMLLFCNVSAFSQVLIIEDFNSGTSFPQGWQSPTLPAFIVTSSSACNGNAARGPLSANSISPELVFMSQEATGNDIAITFDYKILQSNGSTATNEDFGLFEFQYSIDDGKNWITYFAINHQNHIPSTTCKTITHTLSSTDVPAGSEFGWRVKGNYVQGNNYIYIDNFNAIEDVACLRPMDVKVEEITYDSIKVSWDEINGAPATEWEIAYCPMGLDPSNPICFLNNIVTTTGNPHTITGLDEGTKYDIYIRSKCNTNDTSAWTGPITVQTIAVGTDCTKPLEITNLPYVHASDTEIYGNIYSGSPGAACATAGNYLAGHDVVYHYYSNKVDILQIELSGNLDGAVGVFVYESCDDIGKNCFAGAIETNRQSFGIYDLFVEESKDYYFVIATLGANTTTEYVLNISGFDCSTWKAPNGNASYPFFNQTLANFSNTRIGVKPTIKGADLRWYTNSALTAEITDLEAVVLANNDAFWVVQEILGCTSPALHVTFTGFDCNTLLVTSATADSMICDEGTTTLKATAASDNLIWYDQAAGGEAIGIGYSFTTPVLTETTSYWVSEFFRGEGSLALQANPGPTSSSSYSTASGVEFELYEPTVIEQVQIYVTGSAGSIIIQLQDSKGGVQEKTFYIPGGTTNTPNSVKLPLDFEINNPGDGPFRLVKSSGPDMLGTPSAQTHYPYSLGNAGRVINGVSGSTNSSNYYYFYNWTISSSVPLCESDRVEVVAVVNDTKSISIDVDSDFVCVGKEAELTALSVDNDYEYTWSWVDENGTTQTLKSATITPIVNQGTIFSVRALNPNTGCSTEEEVFIDVTGVGDIPVNPITASICSGGIVKLHAGEIIHSFETPINNWSFNNTSNPAIGLNISRGDWKQVSSPYPIADNATSNDGSKFMIASADALGPGSTINSEMISPSFNLVGVASASLEFYQYYRHLTTKTTTASVLVSDDAGITWNSVASYTTSRGTSSSFEKVSINLNNYLGSANVQVKFAYTGGWGWWWAIDNVAIAQTYFNGQVTWMGDNTHLLYLDEDASMPYNGESINIVYFQGEEAGVFDFDIDLYVEGCGNPVLNSVSVEVSKADVPIGDAFQEFNTGARVSDIEVQGQSLLYHLLIDGEYVRQSINAELIDGETYYIFQRIGNCISEYLEVKVAIVCPQATDLEVTVDLASNSLSASAIIFWEHPRDMNSVEGYQIIVKDSEGQIVEDKVVSNRVNYLIVDALPLEQVFTVELYSICDEENSVLSGVVEGVIDTRILGVEDFNQFNLTAYPNPTQNYITIVSEQVLEKLVVITKEGRQIMVLDAIHKEEVQLDLSTLATGTYLVIAKIENQEKVIRVIKK